MAKNKQKQTTNKIDTVLADKIVDALNTKGQRVVRYMENLHDLEIIVRIKNGFFERDTFQTYEYKKEEDGSLKLIYIGAKYGVEVYGKNY